METATLIWESIDHRYRAVYQHRGATPQQHGIDRVTFETSLSTGTDALGRRIWTSTNYLPSERLYEFWRETTAEAAKPWQEQELRELIDLLDNHGVHVTGNTAHANRFEQQLRAAVNTGKIPTDWERR